MKTATAVQNAYPIVGESRDPETGVRCITLALWDLDDHDNYTYDEVKTLPRVLEYDGQIFARTGWNSDSGNVYYMTGTKIAKGV